MFVLWRCSRWNLLRLSNVSFLFALRRFVLFWGSIVHIWCYKDPPSALHFIWAFDRQTWLICRVFEEILTEFLIVLNQESVTIILNESSDIIISRPLSCVKIQDKTLKPPTKNHLLTRKLQVVSPTGSFDKQNTFLIKNWRPVQYLANLFLLVGSTNTSFLFRYD